MTKEVKKIYRYSICFKQKVVEEIKQGESMYAVSRKYGIRGSNTVRNWVKQLGQEYSSQRRDAEAQREKLCVQPEWKMKNLRYFCRKIFLCNQRQILPN
jgi:transposase-like protein